MSGPFGPFISRARPIDLLDASSHDRESAWVHAATSRPGDLREEHVGEVGQLD